MLIAVIKHNIDKNGDHPHHFCSIKCSTFLIRNFFLYRKRIADVVAKSKENTFEFTLISKKELKGKIGMM